MTTDKTPKRVRVRYAPSPTGYVHIGGARTALYNYLFAKAMGGTYILRIEDTDEARSKREYEDAQIHELKWIGITHDEGPDVGGGYGPYRQSERTHLYNEYAQKLIEGQKAYYCFCSEEELDEKKQLAEKEGRPPHYDGKCRNISFEEASSRLSSGEKAVVRFKAPQKSYAFQDIVRERVVFPEGMVGDFVIIRSGGFPVYNYCCVVDDMLMEISHVIRAEEHLSNTLRQLMLYEALGANPPQFAHVSLLIGKDRQKLSKRHGATSVSNYREMSFMPEGLINYLCLLGWSHPDGLEIFNINELGPKFDINRFSNSPAMFDLEKCEYINGQHLRKLPLAELVAQVTPLLGNDHAFHQMTQEWKEQAMLLIKDQVQLFSQMPPHLDSIFSEKVEITEELKDILGWETAPKIKAYLTEQLEAVHSDDFISAATLEAWLNHLKTSLGIKGKNLFMGVRAALTGRAHGPELKLLVPITPRKVLFERVRNLPSSV